jgi:hypothetical protein
MILSPSISDISTGRRIGCQPMASKASVQTSVLDHLCAKLFEVLAKVWAEDISRVECKISSNDHRQSWQRALGQDARIFRQFGQDVGTDPPIRNQDFENHLVIWQPNHKTVSWRLAGTFGRWGKGVPTHKGTHDEICVFVLLYRCQCGGIGWVGGEGGRIGGFLEGACPHPIRGSLPLGPGNIINFENKKTPTTKTEGINIFTIM